MRNALIKFKRIHKDFKLWKTKTKFSNSSAKSLSKPLLNKYSKYKWYYDYLLVEDQRLRAKHLKKLEKLAKDKAKKNQKNALEL